MTDCFRLLKELSVGVSIAGALLIDLFVGVML